MADMILRYKVMPEDSEIDYETLKKKVKEVVGSYDDNLKIKEVKETDVGFGILACEIEFQVDENKGSEELEEKVSNLEEVGDVQVIKMDRL
jgi:translation elongation factor aEF-1 beta